MNATGENVSLHEHCDWPNCLPAGSGMSKPLDPEIKALRAMVSALQTLEEEAQLRAVDWLFACLHHTTQDQIRQALRVRGIA